jgi:lycopene cyclase domain-containing protein
VSYSALVVLGVLASAVLDLVVLRTRLLGRRAFWVAYAIVLAFQLLTNGWLTGRGIVTYSDVAVVGGSRAVAFGDGRVLWAPVEDIGFGFALVLQSLAWWVFWGRRGVGVVRQPGVQQPGVPRPASSSPHDGRPAS